MAAVFGALLLTGGLAVASRRAILKQVSIPSQLHPTGVCSPSRAEPATAAGSQALARRGCR